MNLHPFDIDPGSSPAFFRHSGPDPESIFIGTSCRKTSRKSLTPQSHPWPNHTPPWPNHTPPCRAALRP